MGKYYKLFGILASYLLSFVAPQLAVAQTDFGTVNLGSSSTLTVSLTPTRSTPLTSISVGVQGAASLDFAQVAGGTCAVSSSYSSSCTVIVSFAPKFANTRYGAVVLTDATGNVATAYLHGVGNGPQLAFSYGSSTTSYLVPATLTGTPSAVAIDDSGNIYAGDAGSVGPPAIPARIIKLTYSGGTYTQSTVVSGLNSVSRLSLDGAGNLYYFSSGTLYKATPVNGSYTISTVITAVDYAIADGLGNVFYSMGGSIGRADSIYLETLQTDGTYLAQGALPVNTVKINQADCSPERLDSYAIGGGDILYFYGYDSCVDTYTGPFAAQALYAYTNGLSQPAVLLGGSSVGNIQYEYLPYSEMMSATPYNSLYFWSNEGLAATLTKQGDQLADFIGLTFVPTGVAANAGGDLALSNAGTPGTTFSTKGEGIYVLHRSSPPTEPFPPTGQGTYSYSGGEYIVGNLGNQSITLSGITYPTDFPDIPGDVGGCAASTTLYALNFTANPQPIAACQITAEFAPTASLGTSTSQIINEHATLTSSSLSGPVAIPFTATQVVPTANPVFLPVSGSYTSLPSITITEGTSDAVVWYNIGGNVLNGGSEYKVPFSLASSATIEAYAVSPTSGMSQIVTATYTIVPDFTFTASPTSLIIGSGKSGTSTLTLTPLNGFSSAVSFACSGLPAGATCSFSPLTVTPSGTASSATTVTINIPTTLGLVEQSRGFIAVAFVAIFGCCTFRRRFGPVVPVVAAFVILISASGCSAKPSGTAMPQSVSATITITASAGSLQHMATVNISVP